ncbi:MAG: ATP-binding cassette domain-containing protein [Marinicellaceae bacterium]
MTFISIKNLTIQFDELTVFDDFSKEFGKGLHWIKGPNGCGKSTFLKSLSGIISVEKGNVCLLGLDLHSQSLLAKSKICYVADKPEVYPFMTGIQYLKMIAKIKKVDLNPELYRWLDDFNLQAYQNIEFSQMSFGTRRKITLCACLIANPQILLLDEPFNGLDDKSAKSLKDWLLEVSEKKCILIASHGSYFKSNEYKSILEL